MGTPDELAAHIGKYGLYDLKLTVWDYANDCVVTMPGTVTRCCRILFCICILLDATKHGRHPAHLPPSP
jgi:hypothetical protein